MGKFNILFPNRCVCCGRVMADKTAICDDCKGKLPLIEDDRCPRCGSGKERCSCTPIVNHYDRITAPFYYESAAKGMVMKIKHHCDGISADMAAAFISEECKRSFRIHFDAVTCVPTDMGKFVKRGYNPAALIAKRLAKNMDLPFEEFLKKRFTPGSQKKKDRLKRLESISGAYKIKGNVSGKNILLVDDVKTTGATINECSRILKENGAAKVYVAVLCITAKKRIFN